MAYYNATKVECSKEELKNIYSAGVCPDCGGDLILYEGSLLHCKKCNKTFYNQKVYVENMNPKRGYDKGYPENPKKRIHSKR